MKRRQQEKISILYWSVRTRNSLSPGSSRSFRTQSHWSYTAEQCVNSEQLLRVRLTYWMCSQFTLHHKVRIDSAKAKFKQGKTDGILYSRESHFRITKIRKSLIWPNHVLHRTNRSGKGTRDTVYWVDKQLAQRKGLKFYHGSVNGGWLGRVCTTLHLHAPYILTAPEHLLFVFAFVVRDDLARLLCVSFADMRSMLAKLCAPSMVQPRQNASLDVVDCASNKLGFWACRSAARSPNRWMSGERRERHDSIDTTTARLGFCAHM